MTSPTEPHLTQSELAKLLSAIGLRAVAAGLDDLLARATRHRFTPAAVMEETARIELRERESRSLARRLKAAKIGHFRPIADFDWNWPKEIDRAAIERALGGDLVRAHDNLVLVAAQGLGKTLIVRNIAHRAVMQGHSALVVEAPRMLLDLASQDSARELERRIRHYARPDLLCIDELGYLTYDARSADLLFEVVSRRYETKSIVIATNLAFADWPGVFQGASSITALIDRLTHHADIVRIVGESYRKREAEEVRKARRSRDKATHDPDQT
jgi:DNA replication protein DnaC